MPVNQRCDLSGLVSWQMWCSFFPVIDLECECSDLPMVKYSAGDVVIEEGKCFGALFFLQSGTVEVVRNGVSLGTLSEPGTVLGEISVLLGRPHIAEVHAVDECSFKFAEDADAFLKEHPEVNLYISRQLAKKVDTLSCYMADLKQQYAGEEGHLGMVPDVLEKLLNS